MTQTCSKCSLTKSLSNFRSARFNGKAYRRKKCRSCETTDAVHRHRMDPNRNLKARNRHALTKEERNAYRRSDRQNPDKRAKYILEDTRRDDKRKNFKNDLTLDYVTSILPRPCHHCGDTELQRTLDRIDNEFGHLKNNVVVSCIRCNLIRRDMPWGAWEIIAKSVREVREAGLFFDWTGQLHKKNSISPLLNQTEEQEFLAESETARSKQDQHLKALDLIALHLTNCTETECNCPSERG